MRRIIRSTMELRTLKHRTARRGVSSVVLELAREDEAVRTAERAINRGLRACGCETGSVFVFAGVVFTALRWVSGSRPSAWGVVALLATLAVTGKLIGLAFAEWRLRAAIDRLSALEPS
ncbi:hypothetical protein JRI60_49800 [Archangium violaceum]|uniref:hypothetical protein n=1 Tax=Archangium violaceum TaxID=83451 RepID=UPI001951FAD5|nr:hypothetical protein [Archangium violaceum]QRN96977.1 hypothetical protein JRI60_49800 [Archangium violaceum]